MQNKQRLILVTGISGSGKSTLARRLARILILANLDYDVLTEPFLSQIHRQFDPQLSYGQFCKKWRTESYAVYWGAIAEALAGGASIVASAPCSEELTQPHFITDFRKKHHLPTLSVINLHLVPSVDVLKDHITTRNMERDHHHQTNWEQFQKNIRQNQPVWDCDAIGTIEYTDSDRILPMSMQFLVTQFLPSEESTSWH
ncbi:MAG: ATP-binding protein [Spirochaetales bacterium]|nr:ATP-binding protein [Spirochaetales bacterium]